MTMGSTMTTNQGGNMQESHFQLTDLGEKIFFDRYALKDMQKTTIAVGDTVIVCIDQKSRQREVGNVVRIDNQNVYIALRDGTTTVQPMESVDKPLELIPEHMMARVARGLASVESEDKQQLWEDNFNWLLDDWRFVPGGRILSAAGTEQKLTYFNCYVIPSPKDSRIGIIHTLSEMMEIMSRGGGVGINVSTLRPKYNYVKGVNGRSSGSVSWGGLYSFATGLIEQGGSRRGALMLILNIWHPDVFDFIDAKREAGNIVNANISLGITDDFMDAVKSNGDWDFRFPDTSCDAYETEWDGDLIKWVANGHPVVVHSTVKARDVWDKIIASAWASAEPGVFFIERANKSSNSHYFSPLICTNPCGEQPLPAYGVCTLGAINLSKFVRDGVVCWDDLRRCVQYGVRFLDNIVDATPYFLEENRKVQHDERRIGMGIMGLAEMLIRLRLRYGSDECISFIDTLGKFIATEAYLASSDYAAEKGSFPLFDAEKLLESGFMKSMPESVHQAIQKQGLRNVTLLTVAPTGTTGTMVNTSTGIEPYFSWSYFRTSRLGTHEEKVNVVQEWEQTNPGLPLPDYFVSSMDLTPVEHVRVQAALQRWVDSAISKTCNAPNDYTVEQTSDLYMQLYDLGCKGGTIYRDGSRSEQVLNLKAAEPEVKAPEIMEVKVRSRPDISHGMTIRKDSPLGSVFVTVNSDGQGEPLELFITSGKAGSDITGMAEAMGRLASLVLRIASPMPPVDRLRLIAEQLHGIGGARSTGFGKHRVRSMPDAVGQALGAVLASAEAQPNDALPVAKMPTASASAKQHYDLCPSCGEASFIHEEGCHHCTSCGHSQC